MNDAGDPDPGIALIVDAMPERPAFGAGKALLSFLIVLSSQCGLGVLLAAVWIGAAVNSGRRVTLQDVQALQLEHIGPIILGSTLVQAAGLLLAIRLLARPLANDRSAAGLGFRRVGSRSLAAWACVGAALPVAYMFLAGWLVPPTRETPIGPMVQALREGGRAGFAVAVAALVMAPLVEEVLFRGLMFKGFAVSWGPWASGLVVTVLFGVLHISEAFGYWPSMVSLVVFAVAALLARIRTGSLWPPMAMHLAYNMVAVGAGYLLR